MSNSKTEQQRNMARRPGPGQATIEFALILFFLLVPLLVGVADIASAYAEHLDVVHAANIGARWLTLSQEQQTCSGAGGTVEDVIRNDLPTQLQDASRHSVDWQTIPADTIGIESVEVTITYQHRLLFGAGGFLQFAGSSTMPGPANTSSWGQTLCPTYTPTYTPTGTAPTATRTRTRTPTRTITLTRTITGTPTDTGTPTNTWTITSTPTRTFTFTPTPTPVCQLTFVSAAATKKNNGSQPIKIVVALTDGNNPMPNATVTGQLYDQGTLIEQFDLVPGSTLGTYWYCSSAHQGNEPNFTVDIDATAPNCGSASISITASHDGGTDCSIIP